MIFKTLVNKVLRLERGGMNLGGRINERKSEVMFFRD